MTYHETIHTASLDFWAATLPRLLQAFTQEAPTLGWAELTRRLEELHRLLLAQLDNAQGRQLEQVIKKLEQATQAGMVYAACQGMTLVSAAQSVNAPALLEQELFRLDPARCPAAYREPAAERDELEASLLSSLTPNLQPLAEDFLAYADDAHRLTCYMALYLGFCLFAQPLGLEQPELLPGLLQRARSLCGQLGLPFLPPFNA